MGPLVPSGTLKVQAEAKDAVFRLYGDRLGVDLVVDLKVQVKLVDSHSVLPCIVLLRSCEESLGEEESREPVSCRHSDFNPVSNELDPSIEVKDPRGKRLE